MENECLCTDNWQHPGAGSRYRSRTAAIQRSHRSPPSSEPSRERSTFFRIRYYSFVCDYVVLTLQVLDNFRGDLRIVNTRNLSEQRFASVVERLICRNNLFQLLWEGTLPLNNFILPLNQSTSRNKFSSQAPIQKCPSQSVGTTLESRISWIFKLSLLSARVNLSPFYFAPIACLFLIRFIPILFLHARICCTLPRLRMNNWMKPPPEKISKKIFPALPWIALTNTRENLPTRCFGEFMNAKESNDCFTIAIR